VTPDGGGLSPAGLARRSLAAAPNLKPVDIFVHGTRLLAATAGTLRLAIAGSCTTDLIARAAAVGAAQEGFEPLISQAGFGAWRQEALDPDSGLHRFAPDIVLLVTTWRDALTALPLDASRRETDAAIAAQVAAWRSVWDRLLAASPARRIIQHLPAMPPGRLAGIAELRLPASPASQIAAFRQALLLAGPDITFLDTDGLTQDAAAWYGAKLPFAQACLPAYAARFRAALRQVTGKMKKLLILDLDNTLWGGVIGDDGVDGLELGPGTPKGEAYAAFQAYAKSLAARGVILAVCSKNEPALAESGFTHPGSILAREDFAAFACGWGDKPAAIRGIAARLNLGLDALVFADDNPAECALVREALPDVAVVELGPDPVEFIARLEQGTWFDAQGLSAEDFARGQAYQARAKAASAQAGAGATDLPGFLRGLEMQARIFAPGEAHFGRLAQLEAKTNQFNLTNRRYAEPAIRAFAARQDALVFAATLKDKFGDHGLVSSLIAEAEGDNLVIASWVMSCRVFSRTLEELMLRHLIGAARSRQMVRLRGLFVPTAKNAVVADLFGRLGFRPAGVDNVWDRDLAAPDNDLQSFIEIMTS
jgi:FkbH-like protein